MRRANVVTLLVNMSELAAASSSTTSIFTQTGYGNGTQITVCTATITLPVFDTNMTAIATGGSGGASLTTSSKSGSSHGTPDLFAIYFMLAALALLGGIP